MILTYSILNEMSFLLHFALIKLGLRNKNDNDKSDHENSSELNFSIIIFYQSIVSI